MQGIPKTYKFKKCDFHEFSNVLKSKNAELTNTLVDSISDAFPRLELRKGLKLLIYKNNKIIGYLGLIPFKKMISDLEKYYKEYIKKHPEQIKYKNVDLDNLEFDEFLKVMEFQTKESDFPASKINSLLQQNIGLNKWIKPSHKTLYVSALEIFDEFRSFNTIKVVFNYIKKICIENKYDFVVCHAKDYKVARVYQMGGFKPFVPFNCQDSFLQRLNQNPPMFLNINDKDYYEVTEKLKNKYKKNLFENMKNTKKLYETIMASVAKQVKKSLNEGEYRNDYSSREDYEDEGLDVQGDIEAWIDGIKYFLNDNTNSEHTLPLLATVVGWNELHDEELSGLAESIMLYVEKYGDTELPPFDEVFIDSVTVELFKNGGIIDDWMADVVNENKIDSYDI